MSIKAEFFICCLGAAIFFYLEIYNVALSGVILAFVVVPVRALIKGKHDDIEH